MKTKPSWDIIAKPIRCHEDARKFFLHLHLTGNTFHPEDDARDVGNAPQGKFIRSFDNKTADALNERTGEAYSLEWPHSYEECSMACLVECPCDLITHIEQASFFLKP